MNRRETFIEFSPGNFSRLHLVAALFFIYAVGPVIVFLIFAATFGIFISFVTAKIFPSERMIELIFLLLGLYVIYWTPVFVNQYNAIQVTDGGLKVRIFALRYSWKFIPWEDIIDLKLLPRLDPWHQPMWGIVIKRLTPWHKYLGQFYGAGNHPVILLSSQFENRDLLMEMILEKIPQE